MPTNAIEKRLSSFAGKKEFTGDLVKRAISSFDSGLLNLDISHDFYTRYELGDKLRRIRDCSKILELRQYPGGLSSIHNGNFCKMPVVCVTCADRNSRKKKAIFKPRIEQAAARFKYVYMITLTIKDGEILEDRLNALVKSKKRFRLFGQSRLLKRMKIYQDDSGKWYEYDPRRDGDPPQHLKEYRIFRNDSGEWSKIKAAIASDEIVLGEGSGEIHCHTHILAFTNARLDYRIFRDYQKKEIIEKSGLVEKAGRYYLDNKELSKQEYLKILSPAVSDWYFPENGDPVPVSKISREWIKATAGEGIDIDISPLSFKTYKQDPYFKGEYCATFPKWIAAQAGEVLKYNSKLAEGLQKNPISTERYIELIQRRGARRLFNTYGAFRSQLDSLYISDEEEKYFQYVEWRDSQEYEIRRADYYDGNYHIKPGYENKAVFVTSDKPDNNRRYRLSKQADIVSWYRKVKAAALEGRKAMAANTAKLGAADTAAWKAQIEQFIDQSKKDMRAKLRALWLSEIPPGAARRFAPAPF